MGLILSSHLEKPITEKESGDEYGEKLICGLSSMQGWRETQEDAHNCCLNFDEDTSLFAVYDGHGGHEVAEYCSENFPEFLKESELYKKGQYEEAMKDAFLKFDALLTREDVLAILKEKKQSKESKEQLAELEETPEVLKSEGSLPIEEIITRYQSRLKSSLGKKSNLESASSSGAGSSKNNQPSTSEEEKEEEEGKRETKMEQGQGDSTIDEKPKKEKELNEKNGSESVEKKDDESEKSSEEKVELKTETEKETPSKKEEKETEDKEKDSTKTTDDEKKIKENLEEKPKKALDKTKNCEVNGDISKTDKKLENGEVKKITKLKRKFVNSLEAQALYHQLIYGSSDDESILDDDEDDETFGETESTENGEKEDAVDNDDDDDEDEDEDDENDSGEEEVEDDDDDDDEDDDDDDDDLEANEDHEDEAHMPFDNLPGSSSGCTANVALLRGNTLYVANAGDSRCVVCRKGEAIEMSFDHKPESTIERTRIEKAGGQVSREGRVNNGLNLSRALGDHTYKQNKDLPAEEQMITALPDIKVLEITPEDEFMVLACDGIWNSMSNQEVVDYVKERIDLNPEKLSSICEELFDHCLTPDIYSSEDGAGCDNMTALIIRFKSSRNSTKRPASQKDEEISECKRIKSLSDDDKSSTTTPATQV